MSDSKTRCVAGGKIRVRSKWTGEDRFTEIISVKLAHRFRIRNGGECDKVDRSVFHRNYPVGVPVETV